MPIARVTAKGQVTIPIQVRRSLGIKEGDVLFFEITHEDEIRLRVIRRKNLMDLYGTLPATRPYPGKEIIRTELGQNLERGLISSPDRDVA